MQFKLRVKEAFDRIFSILEKKEEDDNFEYEDNGEIIEVKSHRCTCVINYHRLMEQIWVASNLDGAFHFDYNENKDEWVAKNGEELFKKLNELFG